MFDKTKRLEQFLRRMHSSMGCASVNESNSLGFDSQVGYDSQYVLVLSSKHGGITVRPSLILLLTLPIRVVAVVIYSTL